MTIRAVRLDRVEMNLEQVAARLRVDDLAIQEPLTTSELQAVIEHRRQHPSPAEAWNGCGLPTLDQYTTEELQEIVDFELANPLGSDHQ